MNDASVTRILILAESPISQAWDEILRGPQVRIWLGRAAIPPGEHPEIILANSHAPRVAARDEAGVILVGGSGDADIHLPSNCGAAELCRACHLLGEIVRLRRRERESAQANRDLAAAAMTDVLTGLPNRRAWDQELSRRITEITAGKPLCLALLDLDRFKEVNDTLGHVAGDRLLREAGRAMQENLRQGDYVARLGGDEFGLLLWPPSEAQAAAIVDRVRRRVAEAAAEAGFTKITASAGLAVSEISPTEDTAESMFLAADAALLAAKREGRDRLGSASAT